MVAGEKLSVMGNEAGGVVEGYLDGDSKVEGKFKIGDRGEQLFCSSYLMTYC